MKTEAQKRASQRYRDTKDKIYIEVPKGTKERWTRQANAAGLSLTAFIMQKVEEKI